MCWRHTNRDLRGDVLGQEVDDACVNVLDVHTLWASLAEDLDDVRGLHEPDAC